MAYNYQQFSAEEYNLSTFRGPPPGSKAPDFDLPLAGGGSGRLLQFDGDFLVLETGSITCPLFQGRRPAMARLDHSRKNVSFAVLYVREAHPGATIGPHKSDSDKQAAARQLAEQDGEERRIFIDGLEGAAHAAYGAYPNAVFIINRNGCVVWASDWNNPRATERALDLLQAGKPANVRAFFKPVPPRVSLRILRGSGRGALPDFLRSLPSLIWHNFIQRNLRLIFGRTAKVPPNTQC